MRQWNICFENAEIVCNDEDATENAISSESESFVPSAFASYRSSASSSSIGQGNLERVRSTPSVNNDSSIRPSVRSVDFRNLKSVLPSRPRKRCESPNTSTTDNSGNEMIEAKKHFFKEENVRARERHELEIVEKQLRVDALKENSGAQVPSQPSTLAASDNSSGFCS